MNRPRNARLTILVTPLAAISLIVTGAWAQTPGTPAPSTAPPAATTSPTTPATSPTTPATPAAGTPAAPAAATPTPPAPASAETPATTPPSTAPATPPAPASTTPPADQKAQAADPFGADVTLSARKVVALKGSAKWDAAFETITDSAKTLTALLAKQNITAAGPLMIIYTSTDDAGFSYQAEIPVDQDPKDLTKNMSITSSPEGKTLKFVHHGSYDNMDNTYEAITNHLDEKKLEAKDSFIEEYVTDPLKTSEDKLVINVFVPLK